MSKMKEKHYRIVVDVSKKFHADIKRMAREEFTTIKGYVLKALVKQLNDDKANNEQPY